MKRMLSALGIVIALSVGDFVFGTGAVLEAHHAYGAYYLDQHVSVEGTVTRFLFRNPHALLEITTADGHVYDAEWDAAGRLAGMGVTTDTIKAGDRILVTGNPARDPLDRRIARLTEVRRPADGWRWLCDRK